MTLTQLATITRRGILTAVILITLGLASFIGYQVWHANYIASLPKPEERADVKFGILPKPDFAPPSVSSSNFSYRIATETGGLPNFGKLLKVYFIPKATATFLASDKASALAAKFGIDTPPEATNSSYLFKKDLKTLNLSLDTGNFIYTKEATPSSLPSTNEATLIQNFRVLLSSLGILVPELKNSTAKVDGRLISIWPADIDKFKIVTPNFKTGLIQAETSQSAIRVDDYTSIHFTFWGVDQTSFSTYPIKTTDQALQDLKIGKGSVVLEPKGVQVSITAVTLAYFESENYSPYLHPIYVFEGPNFVAYVPAILDQYITK